MSINVSENTAEKQYKKPVENLSSITPCKICQSTLPQLKSCLILSVTRYDAQFIYEIYTSTSNNLDDPLSYYLCIVKAISCSQLLLKTLGYL